MKYSYFILVSLTSIAIMSILLMTSCIGTSPGSSILPIKVTLLFSEPPIINKPVQLTAKYESSSTKEILSIVNNVTYRINLPDGFELIEGNSQIIDKFDPKTGYSVKATVKSIKNGDWDIEARADYYTSSEDHLGGNIHKYVSVTNNVAIISDMPPKGSRNSTSLITPSTAGVAMSAATELNFKTISIANDHIGNANRDTQIEVISEKSNSVIPIDPLDQAKIDSTDFSKNYVIAVFYGWRGYANTAMEIKRVYQDKNIIYVSVYFEIPAGTVAPGYSSSYRIIEISKESMPQFGDITFKLLDDTGKEKAQINQNITK